MKTYSYEINVAIPRAVGPTRRRTVAHYFRVQMFEGASSADARDVAAAMVLGFPGADVRTTETETCTRIIP